MENAKQRRDVVWAELEFGRNPKSGRFALVRSACVAAGDPESWDLGFVLLSK